MMNKRKKNYTGPVTEFVALKPIYRLMQGVNIGGTIIDTDDSDIEILVNKEEHAGAWEEIWNAK